MEENSAQSIQLANSSTIEITPQTATVTDSAPEPMVAPGSVSRYPGQATSTSNGGLTQPNLTDERNCAGFWLRFVARLIDALIVPIFGAIFFMVLFIPIGVAFVINSHTSFNLVSIYTIIAWCLTLLCSEPLLFALFESSRLQATPGKLALGLVVTDMNGNRISFARAFGRNLAKMLSLLTILVGYILAGFTPKKQALHDLVAGCLVVRKP